MLLANRSNRPLQEETEKIIFLFFKKKKKGKKKSLWLFLWKLSLCSSLGVRHLREEGGNQGKHRFCHLPLSDEPISWVSSLICCLSISRQPLTPDAQLTAFSAFFFSISSILLCRIESGVCLCSDDWQECRIEFPAVCFWPFIYSKKFGRSVSDAVVYSGAL